LLLDALKSIGELIEPTLRTQPPAFAGVSHIQVPSTGEQEIAAATVLPAGHRLEVALRVEHFSNAGISHPNPGENFLQLRLSAYP
jgi:hypothetical protein